MELFTPGHLIPLLIVAGLLFFGWKQLPDMARSVGRSLRIFKTEMKGMTEDDKARAQAAAPPPPVVTPPPAVAPPLPQPAPQPAPAPADRPSSPPSNGATSTAATTDAPAQPSRQAAPDQSQLRPR
ncbi:MAG: sec-independent protein translocase protein TatA [Pseudonocardiales bacterium]|nr:sec-independent protein translocase protein TatA [Pseudonocardiales bacterium]